MDDEDDDNIWEGRNKGVLYLRLYRCTKRHGVLVPSTFFQPLCYGWHQVGTTERFDYAPMVPR